MNIKTRNILIISILVMFLFVGTFAGFVYWIYALNDKTAEFYSMKADREAAFETATDLYRYNAPSYLRILPLNADAFCSFVIP
jgi:uncharacterized membrane protein